LIRTRGKCHLISEKFIEFIEFVEFIGFQWRYGRDAVEIQWRLEAVGNDADG